jgi:hypothetical protein
MRDAETVLGIIQDRGKRGLNLEDVYRQLSAGAGRPWSSAGNATRTFTPDAWTDATTEEGSDWKAG